jgi:hypothetical protein
VAVFVETPEWGSASPERKRALEENLRFAEDLGAEVVRMQDPRLSRRASLTDSEPTAGQVPSNDAAEGHLVFYEQDALDKSHCQRSVLTGMSMRAFFGSTVPQKFQCQLWFYA